MNFAETEIYICFYDRSCVDYRARVCNILSGSKINHCGVLLSRENSSLILASAKTHRSKFVDSFRYHKADCEPCSMLYLGKREVSYEQLFNYIEEPYKGDIRGLVWWWFLGRFLLPLMVPPTCALLTCRLLRVMGYQIKDHVQPQTLFKELTSENYSNSWASWSWEDYTRSYLGKGIL
tara:strand:- start:836 stop:1369 length:534 start_codon:yes stop_codon:yes gene_type:complete